MDGSIDRFYINKNVTDRGNSRAFERPALRAKQVTTWEGVGGDRCWILFTNYKQLIYFSRGLNGYVPLGHDPS